MQDVIGVRIALYFSDDLDVAMACVDRLFERIGATIDAPEPDLFRPQRINVVFRLDSEQARQVSLVRNNRDWVDASFEVQFRTVLSEGWHEVEHDMRYKCQADWAGSEDLERSMNGLVATLETCDWSMLQIFDDLALRHYRAKRWEAMLRAKLRVRIAMGHLSPYLSERLAEDRSISRSLFRFERRRILRKVAESGIAIPPSLDNWVHIINYLEIEDEGLFAQAPGPVRDQLLRCFGPKMPSGNGK